MFGYLPFKKLGFLAIQLGLFFFKSTLLDVQCSNLSLDNPNPINHTQNSPKRRQENSFVLGNTEIACR